MNKLKLWHSSQIVPNWPRMVHPLRFGVVGISGIIVNTVVLWLLVRGLQLPLLLATVLATEAAIVTNFALHHVWTFGGQRDDRTLLRRFATFNLAMIGGMIITALLLALLIYATPLPLLAANIFAIGCATGWNYLASSRWAWGRPPAIARSDEGRR